MTPYTFIGTSNASNPPPAAAGSVRFNVDKQCLEAYDGMQWNRMSNGDDPLVKEKWEKWFAWYPVKIDGYWTWMRQVFRRRIRKDVLTRLPRTKKYEYGSIFDVLADTQ